MDDKIHGKYDKVFDVNKT